MIKTIKKIIKILEETGEEEWKNNFQNLLANYNTTKDLCLLKNKVKMMYGGMGSFSDLVLQKDGEFYVTENEILDKLRKKLIVKASIN